MRAAIAASLLSLTGNECRELNGTGRAGWGGLFAAQEDARGGQLMQKMNRQNISQNRNSDDRRFLI